jgi:hypothetical protein
MPLTGNNAVGSTEPLRQAAFPRVDTKDVHAVAAFTRTTLHRLHPDADTAVIDRLFRDMEDMFFGRYFDYLPIDTRYHDFEHTLQAALCLIQLLEGRARSGVLSPISARQVEIAIASVLLHDTGYLKLRADWRGTGAKYTFVHVIRSCAFAASYLPTIGFACEEVDIVENAIRCTGPRSDIELIEFPSETGNFLGRALATADFLGQMAAPDYVDELPFLYAEFEESDRFFNIPQEKRHFRSARELIEKTPAFWERFVLPRLTKDYQGVYRFLAEPYPDGPNAYLDAIERNMARTSEMIRGFGR